MTGVIQQYFCTACNRVVGEMINGRLQGRVLCNVHPFDTVTRNLTDDGLLLSETGGRQKGTGPAGFTNKQPQQPQYGSSSSRAGGGSRGSSTGAGSLGAVLLLVALLIYIAINNFFQGKANVAKEATQTQCREIADRNWVKDFSSDFPWYKPQPKSQAENPNICRDVIEEYAQNNQRPPLYEGAREYPKGITLDELHAFQQAERQKVEQSQRDYNAATINLNNAEQNIRMTCKSLSDQARDACSQTK